MSAEGSEIVLVTPVWNDAERLAGFGGELALALASASLPIRWVVADDGSDVEQAQRTKTLVEEFKKSYRNVEYFAIAERSRKGGAVYAAWALYPNADWLAFVDADGAISAATTLAFLQDCVTSGSKRSLIAVRAAGKAERGMLRRAYAGAFRLLVSLMLDLKVSDTQCGLKVLVGDHYRAVVATLRERGFIFDVELLAALDRAGFPLEERSIAWRERSGGKIKPLSDAWAMLSGLWRIRRSVKRARAIRS